MTDSVVTNNLRSFYRKYPKLSVKKNEILLYPEAIPPGVFFLEKGEIRMYGINKNGSELVINIYKPVSYFPMNWAINNKVDRYIYEAIRDVDVYMVSRRDFMNYLHQEPSVVLSLLQRLHWGLDGYYLRMESLLSSDAYFKTVVAIVIYVKRFGVKNTASITYTVDVTQRQLAAMAGLTRETVTREIKKIAAKKLIKYQGKTLVVLDVERLEKEIY